MLLLPVNYIIYYIIGHHTNYCVVTILFYYNILTQPLKKIMKEKEIVEWTA